MTRFKSKMAGSSKFDLAFFWFAQSLVKIFCRTWFRMSIEGRENIPKHQGPFVIAPIHRSNLDTPIVGALFPYRVRFMGKDSLWKSTFGNKLLSALGGFPVTRGTADREALQKSFDVIEGGEPLVLFPEGERKSGPIVQTLFDGAVYVAAKYRVPILPVGIGGSERAMKKGSKMIRPVKVHVVIGPLITTADKLPDSGRVPRPVLTTISGELHDTLQELFDRAQIKARA
ncbi:MAG: lysophospholipid acyltransferase family protein [Acidimicrobiia bacterium]